MSIDYGAKRTGIAITDEMKMIASGLTTVESNVIFTFLKNYFATEKVEKVLVGEPRQMNNQPSQSAEIINLFVQKFETEFPAIPVIRVDERFTSKMAVQTMIASGLKKKQRQNKALIDEIAATIMLQDYLQAGKI